MFLWFQTWIFIYLQIYNGKLNFSMTKTNFIFFHKYTSPLVLFLLRKRYHCHYHIQSCGWREYGVLIPPLLHPGLHNQLTHQQVSVFIFVNITSTPLWQWAEPLTHTHDPTMNLQQSNLLEMQKRSCQVCASHLGLSSTIRINSAFQRPAWSALIWVTPLLHTFCPGDLR